ncbi:MAG: hypothetical protein GWN62_08640 [Aliifodinibius sp.]|nr:hypothetical protein [Fodinibius sp.]
MIFLTKSLLILKIIIAGSIGYLDPGSGSFILQVLVASLVGIGFALRGYWSKVVNFFRKDTEEDEFANQDKE